MHYLNHVEPAIIYESIVRIKNSIDPRGFGANITFLNRLKVPISHLF